MSQREAFLKRLVEDEDDTTTRLVYADWLDDQGEHEESDRQRKWPAAKEWLVRFCKENFSNEEVSHKELVEFGRRVVKEESPTERVHMDESLWYALQAHSQEFWKNWSLVTGIPLPPGLESKGFHQWACCAHEVYYWFGVPDTDDPDEETDVR